MRKLYPLLIAQFLSAFADNAVLFAVIAMVMHSAQLASWYVPTLQSAFLIAFVLLAPWVGGYADRYPKSRILIFANMIKAMGAGLLLMEMEPLVAYAVVGIGAAIYSPAKYGILPELVSDNDLVRANSWIEAATILAILLGMSVGAKVADYSIAWALTGTLIMFLLSASISLLLPVCLAEHQSAVTNRMQVFGQQISAFFVSSRSRFVILGGALFWAAAATLRVILVAWAPVVLSFKTATEIAQLTLLLAIGIIVGSMIVVRLIPLEHLSRARIPAYLMGIGIIGLSLTNQVWPARLALFAIGMAGGMFVVPINAALQKLGQHSVGSGNAVALQGFFQNLAMLIAVSAYSVAAAAQCDPVMAMLTLGGIVLGATFLVSKHLA